MLRANLSQPWKQPERNLRMLPTVTLCWVEARRHLSVKVRGRRSVRWSLHPLRWWPGLLNQPDRNRVFRLLLRGKRWTKLQVGFVHPRRVRMSELPLEMSWPRVRPVFRERLWEIDVNSPMPLSEIPRRPDRNKAAL